MDQNIKKKKKSSIKLNYLLKNIFFTLNDKIIIFDKNFKPLLTNINSKKFKSTKDIIDINSLRNLGFSRYTITSLHSSFKNVLSTQNKVEGELCLSKSDYFEYQLSPIKDNKNNLRWILAVFKNSTQHHQVKEELLSIKNQLDVIFENVLDGIVVYNVKGNIVYFNDSAWKLFKFSSKDEFTKQKNIKKILKNLMKRYDIYDQEHQPFNFGMAPTLKAIKGEKYPQAIFNFIDKKTKAESWLLIKSTPITDNNCKVRLVVNIIDDVTEQKESEKIKDEFISIITHELKTPLTSIKAFAQIIDRKIIKQDPSEIQGNYIQMNNQIKRFHNLLFELLDTSMLQTNKLSLQKERYNLNLLLRQVVKEFSKTAKGYKFIIKSHSDIDAFTDKTRITQVITNLLSNATKYSKNQKKIIINIKKDKNDAIVSVKDFGLGIPKDQQGKIFNRFYQIRESRPLQNPSLGLGLYISSRIIQFHGGKMWFESEENNGSTFYFSLPIKKL